MEVLRALSLLFLLLLALAIPPVVTPPEPIRFECNIPLLRSYMLKGRKQSTDTQPHLTCPDVKHNCCTKLDQQRVFHFVNDIFTRRFDDYNTKLLASLGRLKEFHKTVTKGPLNFRGSIARRYFCTRQAQRLIKFPFATLYDNLVSELEGFVMENREFHQKFFCILCDGENHRFFELSGLNKKIFFDTVFCKEHLQSRAGILKLLNVDLQEYLINLQNVVDCKHYAKSYSLRFYDPRKIERANKVNGCLNYLDTSDFFRYCQPICERVQVTKVFQETEGDLEFLNETLALFEKNLAFEEDGFIASSKQRSFYKKILARTSGKKPRKLLAKTAAGLRGKKVTVRNELEEGLDSEGAMRLKMKNAVRVFKKRAVAGKKKMGIEVKRIKKGHAAPERKLLDFEAGVVSISERVLETNKAQRNQAGRVLADQPPPKKPQVAAKSTPAKPYYDPHIGPFYADIILPNLPKEGTICQVDPQPIDFEVPVKTYQINLGINPIKYGTLNFTMNSDEFYKRLFERKRIEKTNIEIQYLLGDFTEGFWEATLEDLNRDFVVVEPDDPVYEPRPARSLLERFFGLFMGISWND
jgi:hypothetical protein